MTCAGRGEGDELDSVGGPSRRGVSRLDEAVVGLTDDVRELRRHVEERAGAQLDELSLPRFDEDPASVGADSSRRGSAPWTEAEPAEQLEHPAPRA